MSEAQKAEVAARTIRGFFNQFGDDAHARILLDVFLEGLMNEEDVFIFGEQEQEGDQVGMHSEGGESGERQDREPEIPQSAASMGAGDPESDKQQPHAV